MLHRHTDSVIKSKPSKGKHRQNDAKKNRECLDKMVNDKSDNSVNPRWQKNGPDNTEDSTEKSRSDNLHSEVKKQSGNQVFAVARMVNREIRPKPATGRN